MRRSENKNSNESERKTKRRRKQDVEDKEKRHAQEEGAIYAAGTLGNAQRSQM